jgi:hypothetical protein
MKHIELESTQYHKRKYHPVHRDCVQSLEINRSGGKDDSIPQEECQVEDLADYDSSDSSQDTPNRRLALCALQQGAPANTKRKHGRKV